MNFVSKTAHTGVFSINLSEMIEAYRKRNGEVLSGSYICFMLDEIASKNFVRKDGNEDKGGCLSDNDITDQFREQWISKVLGLVGDNTSAIIEGWNAGTEYSVEYFGWSSIEEYYSQSNMYNRAKYRLAMMERVLEDKGDIEFVINVSVHSSIRSDY
jgi:hypothetical protein